MTMVESRRSRNDDDVFGWTKRPIFEVARFWIGDLRRLTPLCISICIDRVLLTIGYLSPRYEMCHLSPPWSRGIKS